jgi:hypothetical protein
LRKGAVSCRDCEETYLLDGDPPPCDECSKPSDFTFDEEEAIRLWCLCNSGARDYLGMSAVPTRIKIVDAVKLCEFYGYGHEVLDMILCLEDIAYPMLCVKK